MGLNKICRETKSKEVQVLSPHMEFGKRRVEPVESSTKDNLRGQSKS